MSMEEIFNEFGIPNPGESSSGDDQANTKPDLTDNTDSGIDAKIAQLFDNGQQQQPAQPKPENVQGQQPTGTEGQQQPAQPEKPVDKFTEASSKAFFTESGDVDTNKINDFFLTNTKSFMKFATPDPVEVVTPEAAPVEKEDPVKTYYDKLDWVFENYSAIVQDQRNKGFTEEQIVANIQAHYKELKDELNHKTELAKAIEEQTKKLAPEFEEAKRNRIDAQINKNVVEFSAGLDGVIEGMNGQQVLNQFLLSPKYGGSILDSMFTKDHPESLKMPDAERNKLAAEWFRGFQADRGRMAHVAEFGRLKWMAERMPDIINHAQTIGASKVQNVREAGSMRPSTLNQPQRANNTGNELAAWLGVDSVN